MPVQPRRPTTIAPPGSPRLSRQAAGGLLLLCLILAVAKAQAATPEASRPTIVSLAVLTDPQPATDLAWAEAQYGAGRFQPLPDMTYSAPGQKAFWLRLVLSVPPEAAAGDWRLGLNWPFLRLLQWHIPGYPRLSPPVRSEWNFYLSNSLHLPPGLSGDVVVYARLAGFGCVNINPVIASGDDVALHASLRPWLLGLFFGLMGSMLAYNLFLFLSLRDASYGFYVANAGLLIVYYAFTTGIVSDVLVPASPDSQARLLDGFLITAALVFANAGLFTRSFLLTRKTTPIIDRVLRGQILLALLLVPLCLATPYRISFTLGPPVGILTAVVITLAAVIRLRQGFRPAAVFLCGWGFYVLCGAVHSMAWAGLVAATPITVHAPLAGTAAEVFIMSLALVYRIKLLREHARLAEQERCRLSMEIARSDEAREDLARENTLLSMILDDHRFGIGVVRDGRFQFANRQLARHLGREDLVGRSLAEVPHAMRFLGNALALPADQDSEREVVTGEAGGGRTLRAVGRLLDPARPDQGTVYIVEDVSEARRLENLKNDIDQVMRHDLKSPLATIASVQEALELAGPLTPRQRALTEVLQRTVAAMTARIHLSLNLYKLEAASLEATPEPLPLARLLDEARQELTPFLDAGGQLDVVYEARPEAFIVLGERVLFVSMLVNLLQNALEAAKDQGPVTVTVSDPVAPRLSIANPGEPPEAIRDRLFEKYVTAGKPGGTGLGAYSARLIARAFGGDVTLDASRPGHTTVTITGLRPA